MIRAVFKKIGSVISGSVSSFRRRVSAVTILFKLVSKIRVAAVTRRRVRTGSVGVVGVTPTRRGRASHQSRAMLVVGRQGSQLPHRFRRRLDFRVSGSVGRPQILHRPSRTLRHSGAICVSCVFNLSTEMRKPWKRVN